MAARENQGYLIAVIVLVLLVLVLGLLAFLGISKANEYSEGMAKAKSDLNVEKKVREAHQIEAEVSRALIGDLGESTAEVETKVNSVKRISNDSSLSEAQKSSLQNVVVRVEDLVKAHQQDMNQFIARTEEEQSEDRTWSGLVKNLITITATKHNQLNVQRKNNIEERNRIEAEKRALQERLKAAESSLAKANEDLKTTKKLSSEKEASLVAELRKAEATINKNSSDFGNQIRKLRDARDGFKNDNIRLANENSSLKTRIETLTRENFDVNDGTIVRVSRSNNMVFLDIGRADGLRTNQTFSVYDKLVNNYEKNQEKAKIEVIRITGPHTADARITEEDPVEPITRFDKVVTPTWDPGFNVPIAVAGFIDLDKDGNSDRLRFIRMIENNGGKVVAQHDEEGNVTGQIDSATRYLVMGDPPELNPTGSSNSGIYSAIRELEDQAKANTVTIIDIRKMLNWMGKHNVSSVSRFDPGLDRGFPQRRPSVSNEDNSTR